MRPDPRRYAPGWSAGTTATHRRGSDRPACGARPCARAGRGASVGRVTCTGIRERGGLLGAEQVRRRETRDDGCVRQRQRGGSAGEVMVALEPRVRVDVVAQAGPCWPAQRLRRQQTVLDGIAAAEDSELEGVGEVQRFRHAFDRRCRSSPFVTPCGTTRDLDDLGPRRGVGAMAKVGLAGVQGLARCANRAGHRLTILCPLRSGSHRRMLTATGGAPPVQVLHNTPEEGTWLRSVGGWCTEERHHRPVKWSVPTSGSRGRARSGSVPSTSSPCSARRSSSPS